MGGFAAIAPILSAVGSIAGMFMGGNQAPQIAPTPAPPPVAAAPPPPEESKAAEVKSSEAVVDTEAARIRNQKRRKAAEDERLFNLNSEDDNVSLTKSLLGE